MIGKRVRAFSGSKAFTLLELLVVVAIMAIVAGGVVMVLDDTQEDASLSIAQSEMREIHEAILRFRQDTGHFPKQGPFRMVSEGGSVPEPPEGTAWFSSPANFTQLQRNPLEGTNHALERWNPDTARGWRGPYLSSFGEGEVSVGDNLTNNGSGNPASGTVLRVPGIADPFVAVPVGSYFAWWSGTVPHARRGRPYFYFFDDDPGTPQTFSDTARIVGLGANGVYEQGGGDDLVLYLKR